MSAHALRPRPAEILPPTLLPDAVRRAAPPTDRLASLTIACVVYTALGAAAMGGARHLAAHPPVSTLPAVVIVDPGETPVAPVAKVQPPPAGGARPEGFRTVQPPVDANTIPVVTPTAFPTEDHSGEIAGDPNAPVGPRVAGLPPGPVAPAPAVAAHPGRVVEIDMQSLRILRQVPPVYPALARLVKAQGPVELRMTIDASGVPTEIEVLSGPHPLLVNEALRVARLWRFQPAMVDGVPVAATFRLTVGFRLER